MENNKQIGERLFTFGYIPPSESIHVQVAIARVIGEPLFKAFMDVKKTGAEKSDAEAAGVVAIGMLLSKMDAAELLATMETVFKYVTVDGKRCNMESNFAGRNKELWQVFIAAVVFNFSDFLPDGLFDSIKSKLQM